MAWPGGFAFYATHMCESHGYTRWLYIADEPAYCLDCKRMDEERYVLDAEAAVKGCPANTWLTT